MLHPPTHHPHRPPHERRPLVDSVGIIDDFLVAAALTYAAYIWTWLLIGSVDLMAFLQVALSILVLSHVTNLWRHVTTTLFAKVPDAIRQLVFVRIGAALFFLVVIILMCSITDHAGAI